MPVRSPPPPKPPPTNPHKAYHSIFLEEPNQQILANTSLLPLRTRTRGPAQQLPPLTPPETPLTIDASHPSYDIADETLSLFRANTFFRNFEIHGPADRTLIYGILYLSQLLSVVKVGQGKRDAERVIGNIALDTNFAVPGDAAFPLNQAFEAVGGADVGLLRGYLGQFRQELAARLLERLYEGDAATPSKWWMSFAKRRFMGKQL